uniref:MARVEL domain-containing protein n=1 Tax=Rhabditophanes sp. KR3021 TaxID=114890 RepID=A0AC35UHI9_9BILA
MLQPETTEHANPPHTGSHSLNHAKSEEEFTVVDSLNNSPPAGSSVHQTHNVAPSIRSQQTTASKASKYGNQVKLRIIPDKRQGQLNTHYLSTIPGIMKIAELLLCSISFILAICTDRRSSQSAWTEHLTFEAMLLVLMLILGYVCFPHLTLEEEKTREGLIVVELLFYGLNSLFFFIAVWLMVHLSASFSEAKSAAIMSSVLCVAVLVLFVIETIKHYKAWKGENSSSIVRENIQVEDGVVKKNRNDTEDA